MGVERGGPHGSGISFNGRHTVIKQRILTLAALGLFLASTPSCTTREKFDDPESPRAIRRQLKHDQPLAAAQQRFQARLSADGTVPANALMNAKDQRDHLLTNPVDGAGISPDAWTWIGPGNIGGRLRAIIIHPTNHDTMWVGSASGGVWKTTNGGASWFPLDDFMASLSVGCMAIDPINPNILYAGTGEGFFDAGEGTSNTAAIRGAGIFKTTDGGTTWTQLPSTADENWHFVNRLVIHPTNPSIIVAATASGIYRTTNGGDSWTRTATIGTLDVKADPSNPNRLVAGGDHHDPGAYFSTDGGVTWQAASGIPTNVRVELAYAPSNPSIVYAGVSISGSVRIYRSSDGGQSYASRGGSLSTYSAYNSILWVDPTNPETIVAGGVYIYRSTNGGTSMTRVWSNMHPDFHVITTHPLYNGGSNRVLYIGHDGGISRVPDALGSTYTDLNNNLGVTQFYGVAVSANGNVVVGGTQDNGTLRYAGNPQDWRMTFGGDGGFCAADPADPNYVYGEIYFAQIFRSTNGGQNWSYIHNGISETNRANCNFIPHFILDPNNSNRMLAGCRRLWRTNNVKGTPPTWTAIKPAVGFSPDPPPQTHFLEGNHFEENDPRNISTITVAPGNSDRIYVGHNNGHIYFTDNGQDASPTWMRIDDLGNRLPPDRWVSRIVADPANAQRIYVSFMGWEPDNVWTYDVSAQQWTAISGTGGDWPLPSAPVSALEVHRTVSGWIYAGTDIGIFTSTDDGATWSAATQGPGTVPIDELIWKDNSTLVAATHGRGAYLASVSLDIVLGRPDPGIAGQVNRFTTTNATAGRRVHLVYSMRSGSTAVPGCGGVFLGLAQPQIAGDSTADGNGDAVLNLPVPPGASGRTILLQSVERATCRVSNVVQFTFQ